MAVVITDIIFDFDGTLVDTASGILLTLGSVLRARGNDTLVPVDSSVIGPPLGDMLRHLTGCEDPEYLAILADDYKRIYDHEGFRNTNAFPNVNALIHRLFDWGIGLHIATNKRMAPTRLILEDLGWAGFFKSVYSLDMREPRIANKTMLLQEQMVREQLKRETTCYVGDRVDDGFAADAQPMAFFFASWGYGEHKTVLEPHWPKLSAPEDLAALISGYTVSCRQCST